MIGLQDSSVDGRMAVERCKNMLPTALISIRDTNNICNLSLDTFNATGILKQAQPAMAMSTVAFGSRTITYHGHPPAPLKILENANGSGQRSPLQI